MPQSFDTAKNSLMAKSWLQKPSVDYPTGCSAASTWLPTDEINDPACRRKTKEGKASRILNSQIGSALVSVHRNAQNHELKLPESTRVKLFTVVTFAISTDCLVRHLLFLSQNVQLRKKIPARHSAPGEIQTLSPTLGVNSEGKGRVKDKASRKQSSFIGYTRVCVLQDAQHCELNLTRGLCSLLW